MLRYSRTPDNELTAPESYTVLRTGNAEDVVESVEFEDEPAPPVRPTFPGLVQSPESEMFDAHRNDVAMIISAPYEFQTFFPSDQLDTYIWLQVPSAHDAAKKMACTGICFQSSWLLPYSSAALRRSGLTKFAELLDDERYQVRTYNRLAANGVLPLSDPSKLKRYHLDLGPSDDSDLRAEHLEALTLPQGIIRYSEMVHNGKESVPNYLAGGHDDSCSCFQLRLARDAQIRERTKDAGNKVAAALESDAETGQSCTAASGLDAGTGQSSMPAAVPDMMPIMDDDVPYSIWSGKIAPEYQIADYCEIRHICNVIRLLMAIAGHRLLLNSAARVYTLAGLAKLFGLSSSDGYYDGQVSLYADFATFSNNFRGMMSKWFFSPANAKIVDILPEECFIIAWNLKLAPVARAAFRIIVAEYALCDTSNDEAMPHKQQSRRRTPFGRSLSGLLNDDMENIVAYASSALIQRVLKTRDSINEKVSVMASNMHLNRLAGNVAGNVPGGSPVYILAKYPMFKEAEEGIMHTLVGLSDTLETFAFAEQAILSNCPGLPFIDTVRRPTNTIHAASVSAQALLHHIAMMMIKNYRGASADSSTSFPSTHFHNIKQSIALYTRNRLSASDAWFHRAYERLSNNQKCMTTMFWNGLWSVSCHLSRTPTDMERTYTDLLHNMAVLVSEAVTPNPENARMGHTTEIQLRGLQRDLLSRLNDLGIAPGSGSDNMMMHTFEYKAILPALRKLICKPALHIYDCAYFSPSIEMSALHSSPHLILSLSADEFRFLPMWAGGNNDETGAVFQEALPVANLGPVGPGPAYHTGETVASAASTAGADFSSSASMVAPSVAGPPSVSSDGVGSFGSFVDLRLSDARAEHAESIASGSTDYQAAREFSGLDIQSQRQSRSSGDFSSVSGSYVTGSALNVTSSSAGDSRDISSLAGERSAISSSNRSLAASSDMASSFVVVEDETPRTADVSSAALGTELASTHNTGTAFTSFNYDDLGDFGVGFDDDDDDEYDDADNIQEFIDDDDADARSDDTVMPDREEILQSMRQGEDHV